MPTYTGPASASPLGRCRPLLPPPLRRSAPLHPGAPGPAAPGRGQGTPMPPRVTGRAPSGDAGGEATFGVFEPTAHPLGYSQNPQASRVQSPLSLAARPGPATRTRPSLGIAVEHGEIAAPERDRRGNVRQQARRPADGRLERLVGGIGERALGGIQRHPGRFHIAADEHHPRLRQQQPWAGPGQLGGQRRDPPLNRRAFTSQEDRVKCRSISRAAQAASPAARACRIVSSASPCSVAPGGRRHGAARAVCRVVLAAGGPEQVGEQVVIAPPAAHLIQRHQEQAGRFDWPPAAPGCRCRR